MSDDDDIAFRDKVAVEILSAMIGKEETYDMADQLINGGYYQSNSSKEMAQERILLLIRASYKIADLMRKVRLNVFK